MKLRLIPLFTALVFTCLSTLVLAAPRVAIVDFENRAQYRSSWHLGTGAADMLTTELVKINKLEVFERERMAAILREQDFGQSGRIDPSTAAEIGRLIGVDYIVTGAITEFGVSDSGGGGGGFHIGKKGFHATVDIRMIDVMTGRIIFADSGEGYKRSTNVRVMGFGGGERNNTKKESAAMRMAMKDLAGKISEADLDKKIAGGASDDGKFRAPTDPSAVLIAYIDGNDVTLNKGIKAKLVPGKRYKIKRPTGTVKDPNTGRVIKVKYKTTGEIKVTAVEDTYSDGILTSNQGVEVGDVVDAPKVKRSSSSSSATYAAKPKPEPVYEEEPEEEPATKSKSSSALGFISKSFGKTTVNTNRGGDVNIDAFDEDALEDYYESLKASVKMLSTVAGLSGPQYEQYEQQGMMQAWSGIVVGQLETAQIELDEWPTEAKQEGWKALGKRIKKYNKLFAKHKKRILKNEAISADFKESLEGLELVNEENFFGS